MTTENHSSYRLSPTPLILKKYFSDIKTEYINSFLPAATLEPGQYSMSHTKYLFRVRKGAYLVHPEALKVYAQQLGNLSSSGEE